MSAVAVVPTYDGRRLLASCLGGLEGQGFDAVVVVDDGSRDGTAAWLARDHPSIRVLRREVNAGFAVAAQAGLDAAADGDADWVALVNSDVVLSPGWLTAARSAGDADAGCGSVATRLLAPDGRVDDAGDVMRRDGVVEQRGRGRPDGPRFATAGPAWGASGGAALYRVAAVRACGGLDPAYVNYLEDAELALRLRLAGWRCAYAPGAVGVHLGSASAGLLARPVGFWTARNTLLLVARWFPWRWAPMVAYRQLAWLRQARRAGVLGAHLAGLRAGTRLLPGAWRSRGARRHASLVPMAAAVPPRPWRGPRAGGHAESPE